jgi:hypothetical protein
MITETRRDVITDETITDPNIPGCSLVITRVNEKFDEIRFKSPDNNKSFVIYNWSGDVDSFMFLLNQYLNK